MVTEEPPAPPPQPGSYDWIVGGTSPHAVDVPFEFNGQIRVLRVEITAKARVSPNRPWGYIVLVWGIAVIGLLLAIALKPAHAADQWRTTTIGPNTYTTGPDTRARTWTTGPNTYTETEHRDGTKERCRTWTTGPNTYTRCD